MAAQKRIGPAEPNLALEAFLGRKRDTVGSLVPRKAKSKTVAASRFAKTIAETREMIESGEWEGFTARHVVALYDLMHERCYGVIPDTTSKERYKMTVAVGAFVKARFGGDYEEAVEYFRWLWDREIDREAWAKTKGILLRKRLGFWLTINATMVTDYRVDMERKRTLP